MGRQWNTIIESLGPLTGGTMSINANLTEIEALLTTLQADVADGITVSSGTVTANLASVVTTDTFWNEPAIKITGGNGNGIDIAGKDYSGNRAILDEGGGIPVYPRDNADLNAPFPVAGTVTANPTYATSGGTGPTTFTSTSYGTIAASNSNRKGLTVFNEGAGNLHITIGTATTSTSSYTIRISSGDYYELPYNYTGLIGGIFATAGTARVTEIV